ncbi:MAG: hypothetical protein GF364_10935 [Candidatus Lokiarchaeota archaeon]|nr:hypothetical protein [Candidatus Lokiarchaeota archaeon]
MKSIATEKFMFPEISGHNLEKKEMHLPRDFRGQYNVIIVAFQRWHQGLVNEWVYFLKKALPKHKHNLEIYELPTLNKGWAIMKWMIDGGMRAGIYNKDTREHTITLYTNKGDFKEALHIQDEKTIYVYLLDSDGMIHHRHRGEFTRESGENLIYSFKNISS